MKIKVINESREGHFYSHWTNLNGLIGILQSNSLIGSNDGEHHLKNKTNISLSRLGNGSGIPNFIKTEGTIASVRIVLDIGKLAQKYKISPVEFFNDPKDRSIPTQRTTDDSEYEEAVIVGNTQKSTEIFHPISGEYLGMVIIDLKKMKLAKVVDSDGDKVAIGKKGEYNLSGNEVFIEFDYTPKGRFIGISISVNGVKEAFDIDEFEDYEKGSIQDIKKYITRIELADIIFDNSKKYLVKSDKGIYVNKEEYINKVLKEKQTAGLNSDKHQHTVNHRYSNLDKFLKFLEKELGKSKIGTYKSPKSFYSIEGDSSKGEYTVVSNNESDNELYLVQIKFGNIDRIMNPYEYRLISAVSEAKAIYEAREYFYLDDSLKIEEVKTIPFIQLRHIENSKYSFINFAKLLKLINKKKNCKSYFDFIKFVVSSGIKDKMDIKVLSRYSEKSLSKKIKVDEDTLKITVK